MVSLALVDNGFTMAQRSQSVVYGGCGGGDGARAVSVPVFSLWSRAAAAATLASRSRLFAEMGRKSNVTC